MCFFKLISLDLIYKFLPNFNYIYFFFKNFMVKLNIRKLFSLYYIWFLETVRKNTRKGK